MEKKNKMQVFNKIYLCTYLHMANKYYYYQINFLNALNTNLTIRLF